MKCKTVFANCWTYVSAFLGIAGLILAIVVIPGEITIAYSWLILFVVALVVLYIILFVGIYNLKNIGKTLQNMSIAECYLDDYNKNITYLAVEPYSGIHYDQYVSIYYRNERQRRLIGIGIVENIIDDNDSSGYINVKVESMAPNCEKIWKQIRANEKKTLKSVKLAQSIIRTNARVEVL